MSKKRCAYCGKIITDGIKHCNDTCKNSYEEFKKNIDKNSKIFGDSR